METTGKIKETESKVLVINQTQEMRMKRLSKATPSFLTGVTGCRS